MINCDGDIDRNVNANAKCEQSLKKCPFLCFDATQQVPLKRAYFLQIWSEGFLERVGLLLFVGRWGYRVPRTQPGSTYTRCRTSTQFRRTCLFTIHFTQEIYTPNHTCFTWGLGVCLTWRGCLPYLEGSLQTPPEGRPPCGQTNARENITFWVTQHS